MRFGFGDIIQRLGLANAMEQAGQMLHLKETPEIVSMTPQQRFRTALAEMGPTFVKLGQILSTRVDLFPPEWTLEFGRLQDRAPVVPFSEIENQLKEDLGAAPEEVFAEFDKEPLAAASIAQVHRARLKNGDEVIVKIRRPGIESTIESDLRLLGHLARYLESESDELSRYHPLAIMRQFSASLNQELDLAAEGRHSERFARNFSDNSELVIPKIYWQYTGRRINVQQQIKGIPGRDYAALDLSGLNRKILANNGARAIAKMILEDGFFHADPHPGNFFYLANNRVAMIDFGMVGRLSHNRRHQLLDLLYGLIEIDPEMVVEVLMCWTGNCDLDIDNLKQDVDKYIDQYHGVPIKELDITTILVQLTSLLRDYRLALPPDLTMMIKTMITLEGVARKLDPEFDTVSAMQPYLQSAMRRRYDPEKMLKSGFKSIRKGFKIIASLPQDLRSVLTALRKNQLQMHVDITKLQEFGDQLDRAASRIAIGMVLGALIVGSSIVMTTSSGEQILSMHNLGILGYVFAGIFGIWLLLSIRGSGKK